MTDPRPLSDVDLLVWAVVLGYRDRLHARGNNIIMPGYPPCPTCGEDVYGIDAYRRLDFFESRITVKPCGHGHTVAEAQMERVHEHIGGLLALLDSASRWPAGKGWTTDDIVREARTRLGQPEATEATGVPASAEPWTQLEARAFNAVLPALHEAGEWLPLSARRKVARAILAELKPELDAVGRDESELTAEEARGLADDLGLQLYEAQDALAFVGECCDIADREQRAISTGDVREWLKGAQCGRQLVVGGPRCTCGGRFPLHHFHADQHQPEEQP
ncbi:hypothetical protein [Streptomyces sp. NPDC000351]|uniref:hypothetical protein n=1 Tax=Streptomyces sp. NPDC000351 TaxID=3154250 RepID=UPI003319835E